MLEESGILQTAWIVARLRELNPDGIPAYTWSSEHKEQNRRNASLWVANNHDRRNVWRREYQRGDYARGQRNIRCSRRYARDIKWKIAVMMSSGIRCAIRGAKAGRHWETLVGYTVKDLIKHLQKRFVDGMTWDNYGNWHIDHIIPQSAFHFTTTEDIDFKRCWALSNLQPLWEHDNLAKGTRITKSFQPSLKF